MKGTTEKFNSLLDKLRNQAEEKVYFEFTLDGKKKRFKFSRKGLNIIIGRSAECNLVIEHNSVSRKHARLWFEDNIIWVEDLGSKNGTYIKTGRVNQKEPVRDELRVGEIIIKINDNTIEGEENREYNSIEKYSRVAFSLGLTFIFAGIFILIFALYYSFLY